MLKQSEIQIGSIQKPVCNHLISEFETQLTFLYILNAFLHTKKYILMIYSLLSDIVTSQAHYFHLVCTVVVSLTVQCTVALHSYYSNCCLALAQAFLEYIKSLHPFKLDYLSLDPLSFLRAVESFLVWFLLFILKHYH